MNKEREQQKGDIKNNEFPIFRSAETYGNMKKERFIVPQQSTFFICENFVLTEESQKTTVNKLVDRTPDWMSLEEEEQKDAIKATLVLQTVAEYLYKEDYITKACDMYENGYDKDGNVVLDAFYITKTQEQIKWEDRFKAKKRKKSSVVKFKDYVNKKKEKPNA